MTPQQQIDGGETMAEMWEGFARIVMADTQPGSPEWHAMRGAFYGGGMALFNWMMVQLDEGDDATDADLAKMDAMQAELHGFFLGGRRQ